jgi:hypothetical protein
LKDSKGGNESQLMKKDVEYFVRHAVYLSYLDSVTFERQSLINKIYLGVIVLLSVVVINLATKFSALDAEIAVRRATSNARVQAWQERLQQDSLQRIAWEAAKLQMLAKEAQQRQDSLLNQIRSR